MLNRSSCRLKELRCNNSNKYNNRFSTNALMWGYWTYNAFSWLLTGEPFKGLFDEITGYTDPEVKTLRRNKKGELELSDEDQFMVILCVLASTAIKADGDIDKHELAYIRNWFTDYWGPNRGVALMSLMEKVLPQQYDVAKFCENIKKVVDYEGRLMLLQMMYGISNADFRISETENKFLASLAKLLGLDITDFYAVRAMYIDEIDAPYKILKTRPSVSDQEIKDRWHHMSVKFHPDKFTKWGQVVTNAAQERYDILQRAYEKLRLERGMR